MDIVKRLRPALREPRAVGLECGKVVVDHGLLRNATQRRDAENAEEAQRKQTQEPNRRRARMCKCLPWCSLRFLCVLCVSALKKHAGLVPTSPDRKSTRLNSQS